MTTATAERRTAAGPPAVSVCLLGAEAAGKTCFLAGLGILGKTDAGPAEIDVAAADTASAQRLRDLTTTLRNGRWPNPSNLTELLHLKIALRGRFGRRRLDLLSVDYPGEDFRKAIGDLDRDANRELVDRFAAADVLLLLVNPADRGDPPDAHTARLLADRADDTDQPLPAELGRAEKESAVWHERHEAMLNAVFQAGERRDPPDVAVVLTACDGPGDPATPEAAEELLKEDLAGAARAAATDGGVAGLLSRQCRRVPAGQRPPAGHARSRGGTRRCCGGSATRGLRRTVVRGGKRTVAGVAAAVVSAGLLFGGWTWRDAATRDGLLAGLRDESRPVAQRLLTTPIGAYEEVDAVRKSLHADFARELIAAAGVAKDRPALGAVRSTGGRPQGRLALRIGRARGRAGGRRPPRRGASEGRGRRGGRRLAVARHRALSATPNRWSPPTPARRRGRSAAEFRTVREAAAARPAGVGSSRSGRRPPGDLRQNAIVSVRNEPAYRGPRRSPPSRTGSRRGWTPRSWRTCGPRRASPSRSASAAPIGFG